MEQIKATAMFKIKEGKLEGFKELIPVLISAVREKEPGALNYDWYLNEKTMECVVVETYADSQAVLSHAGNVGELLQKLLEIADISVEIYGNPNEELRNAMDGLGYKIYPFYSGL